MNSDTPETDKAERMAFAQEYMVPTEFSRKLERERDEARAQAKKLDGAYEDATNYYARWSELIEERDEARAEIKRLQKGGCARDQMTTQFCAEAVGAIRERDDARSEATRYRLLYYKQAGIDPDLGRLPWETKP